MDTLETKNTRRKYMRGVSYDARIRKYVAVIRINGKRIYLGSFEDAEDAAAAHALARHDNPIRRGGKDGGPTFAEAYDEFLERERARSGSKLGVLQPGAEFTAPSGQHYFLVKIDTIQHPKMEKVKWVYYRWHSNCSECKADFITSTRYGRRSVNGMTRTCAKHRKGGPRADEPQVHAGLLKTVRAAQQRQREEAEDIAEADEILFQYSRTPGATREGNRRVYREALAAAEARRAARKAAEGLV